MYVVVLYNLRYKGTKNFFISAVILIKSIVYKPYAIINDHTFEAAKAELFQIIRQLFIK